MPSEKDVNQITANLCTKSHELRQGFARLKNISAITFVANVVFGLIGLSRVPYAENFFELSVVLSISVPASAFSYHSYRWSQAMIRKIGLN